jgi:hypothetical protein
MFQPKPVPQTNKPEIPQKNAKQPILDPKDKPSSNSQAPTISNPQQLSRKRQNITALESNTKKGPGFVKEIEVPPDSPPSTPLSSTLALLKRHLPEPSLKQLGKARKRWFQTSQHLFWT